MRFKTCFQWMVILLILLSGCEAKISTVETVNRGGRLYRMGSDRPYCGYVVGQSHEDYRTALCRFRKHYRNGRLNGDTHFWYLDGTIESIEPYRDGRINGVVSRFYPDGKLKCRLHIIDNKRGGRNGEVFWLPDGRQEIMTNLKAFLSGLSGSP